MQNRTGFDNIGHGTSDTGTISNNNENKIKCNEKKSHFISAQNLTKKNYIYFV